MTLVKRVLVRYYDGPIQLLMYQAPEVVFQIPWSYPVDIWNGGLMVGIWVAHIRHL